MKIYLVGGAVRDKLLGLTPKEKDWVVVGSSPDELLAAGYRQVGKDFPVFLHPKTQEEYALARSRLIISTPGCSLSQFSSVEASRSGNKSIGFVSLDQLR